MNTDNASIDTAISRRQTLVRLGVAACSMAALGAPATLLAQSSDKVVKFILPVSAGSAFRAAVAAAD